MSWTWSTTWGYNERPIPFRSVLLSVPARWILPTPPPPFLRARLPHLHPVILQVLFNRGLAEPEAVEEFFGRRVRPDDPFLMKGMGEAVERLRTAIVRREPIVVYGDFDADGVTATVLVMQTLQALGAVVRPYIPHRVDEGYGLNNEALAALAQAGARVVLTVDCGIRSQNEVAFGQNLGLDIIISDHHTPGSHVPDALAVINPRQPDCRYPFDGLAGVGVAFKLAQALLRAEQAAPIAPRPPRLTEEDLLDLVALGTVADLMPLRGENRLLVQQGLERLRQTPRPGVLALARTAGLQPGQITAYEIGFKLAPRLNAAGRLSTAMLAYDLLMAPDPETAQPLAVKLDNLNRERQSLTDAAVQWATTELGEAPPDDVILVGRPGLPSGILGLAAGKLKDLYYRPVLVVELGSEEVRGSARSIPEFHITEALDRCADLLLRYGGHAAAAGFTLRHDRLPALRRRLNAFAAQVLHPDDRIPKLTVDAIVPLRDMDYALLGKLQELEPTGAGNEPPVLAVPNLMVRQIRRLGSNGEHLRLILSDGYLTIDAIAFRQGHLAEGLGMRVDVAGYLEDNIWQDQRRLQLRLCDIRPAGRGIPLGAVTPA